MTKVVVTIELDNEAHAKEYGPGSAHWEKYHYSTDVDTGVRTPLPASEYKSLVGKLLNDAIVETLREGFYDWASRGWLKLTIDGKPVRDCCHTVEGDAHANWCPKVNGPEASET